MKRLFLLITFLLVAANAHATTTWVSATGGATAAAAPGGCASASGTSDPGTYYRTIRGALACFGPAAGAGAGHTVMVKSGSYNSENMDQASVGDFFPKGSDLNTSPFTLKCQTQGACSIKSNAGAGGYALRIYGSGAGVDQDFFAVIDGFSWDLSNDWGLVLGSCCDQAKRVRLIRNDFHDISQNGVSGGHNIEWINNKFHDGNMACVPPTDCSGGLYGYPMYIGTNNNLIDGNEFYNFPSFGVHLNHNNTDTNTFTTIRNNYFHNYGTCNQYPNPINGNSSTADAIIAWHIGNTTVDNNVADCGPLFFGQNSSGIGVNTIVNNTIVNMSGNGSTGGIEVVSNSIVKNNILFNITNALFSSTPAGVANNMCPTLATGCTQSGNPNLNANYIPQSGSAAINHGVDLSSAIGCTSGSTCTDKTGTVIRPQGSSWDIGAFEFVGTTAVVQINSTNSAACNATLTAGNAACTITGQANNTITISGVSSQTNGSVVWACTDTPTPRCTGNGTTSGTPSVWTTSTITLKPGINIVTVTGTDASSNSGVDTISVTFAPTFPGNTLVGAWGFEEGSGTSTTDSSGNGHTATLTNGPTWSTTGKYGKAISFDGINDFLSVADDNVLDLSQSFTISAWVQPVAAHADFRPVLVKNGDPVGAPYRLFASVQGFCGSGGVMGMVKTNGTSGPEYNACSSTPLAINTWTFLAVTYDGSNLKLYKSVGGGTGIQLMTTTPVSPQGYMEATALTLAIGGSEFGEFFHGLLDEVRLYNWAIPLTAASNTTFGTTCSITNQSDNISSPSLVGNANCPVVALAPPLQLKISAGASQFKIGPASTGVKFGNQ